MTAEVQSVQRKRPLLYSFRRCPYAIRARLALQLAGISVEIEEVSLKNKPAAMLTLSPKGTVPVMLLPDGRVLEQSLDIMFWALRQDSRRNWFLPDGSLLPEDQALIAENDGSFKKALDAYKYPERHPQQSQEAHRAQAEVFFQKLEQRLQSAPYLSGQALGVADLALLSFIRQCAAVDQAWFDQSPYPALIRWLHTLLASDWFCAVMQKPAAANS